MSGKIEENLNTKINQKPWHKYKDYFPDEINDMAKEIVEDVGLDAYIYLQTRGDFEDLFWLPEYKNVITPKSSLWEAIPNLSKLNDDLYQKRLSAHQPGFFLVSALATIAASTHPSVTLPWDTSSMNLLTLIIGKSGSGKSSSFKALGTSLIFNDWSIADNTKILASGQGAIEAFLQRVTDNHGASLEQDPRILFTELEGERTETEANTKTSNLMPTLRSLFSCETTGSQGAKSGTQRHLTAGTYSTGVILAIQPRFVSMVLGEAHSESGLSQRFLVMGEKPKVKTIETVNKHISMAEDSDSFVVKILEIDSSIKNTELTADEKVHDFMKSMSLLAGNDLIDSSILQVIFSVLPKVAGIMTLSNGETHITWKVFQAALAVINISENIKNLYLNDMKDKLKDKNIKQMESIIEKSKSAEKGRPMQA